MKIKWFLGENKKMYAQHYRFLLILMHENKVDSFWYQADKWPALQICFQHRAWKQSNFFVKTSKYMHSITELFSTLGMKTKYFLCENKQIHAQYYRTVFNLGHENKVISLWKQANTCIPLILGHENKMENLLISSSQMASITESSST